MYSPIIKPSDSAMLMQVELVPHCFGSCHERIRRALADLLCHSMSSSVSCISGARIVTQTVATPSFNPPSMLTNIGKSCCMACSMISELASGLFTGVVVFEGSTGVSSFERHRMDFRCAER